MSEALKSQRTYVLVGHGGSGKTSVAEMLLFNAGAANRLGKIEDGTTALDFEPEEIKRRGSIQPSFANFKWNKNQHFLIDTPGDNNFNGDLPYTLTGADAAVFVIDAVDGVKPLTRKAWAEVKKVGLPALVFINKMDRDRADFQAAFTGLKDSLGIKPVLLHYPIGEREQFKGVVDLLENTALFFDGKGGAKPGPIPPEVEALSTPLREAMIENIAESDEELMEKYLEAGELAPEELKSALVAGVKSGELVPVLIGSGLLNMGGPQLLDAIQAFLPSPMDHPYWEGEDGSAREGLEAAPVAAFVFKTLADPFAGQLTVVRVISGTLSGDQSLVNSRTGQHERMGQLLLTTGKDNAPCKTPLGPGSIVTLAKLKDTNTGDTLSSDKAPFALVKPKLAPTLITYALAPKDKGDEDKVYQAMAKLLDEDVTLKLGRDEETADTLLSGMGQNHIEISVEKARRRYKVDIVLKTPKVPYRETFKTAAREIQGRHKKQTGGRGQFGDCWIHLEPQPKGAGYTYVDAIVGGSIPRQYIPAVDKGVQESAARGVLAGFPVIDFKVTLYDGSYHNVDSSEMAFKIAGSIAFKRACEKAKMILLEPIMTVTVAVPDSYMGDVIGDLSSRRGKVLGSESQGGVTEIKAHVPMSEVLKYAPDLRSMTAGQGTFTMEFSNYEECPPPIAAKVIEENKREAAEEE